MLKWLLVIVVVAAVYFFFIKKKPLPNETQAKGKQDKDHDDDADMVACRTCGTYISLNEALLQNGEYFCSDECRKA